MKTKFIIKCIADEETKEDFFIFTSKNGEEVKFHMYGHELPYDMGFTIAWGEMGNKIHKEFFSKEKTPMANP